VIVGDTIAAIATASGRSGVAVVRVSGPEAAAIARRLTRADAQDGGSGRQSLRVRKLYFPAVADPAGAAGGAPIDEGVVLEFKAPHSYTGEDVVEFQCHGGTITPRRVLEACFAAGARLARRGEFTQRAFLNGKLDFSQAESVLDLINAKTQRAADAALEGLAGGRSRDLRCLYETALELSTRLEHSLDVDEGELPEDFSVTVRGEIRSLAERIADVLRKANEGRLLRTGALVVLAGLPNAGKSSLMNALLGESRAIVSDRPGTTRDSIEEGLDVGGWPVRLVDTAGIRDCDDTVESEGVRRAQELLKAADVVIGLGAFGGRETLGGRLIGITAKCDLVRGEGINVSAKTGEGIEELKRAIVLKLEEQVKAADASDVAFDTSPLRECQSALASFAAGSGPIDPVLAANAVRAVAERLGGQIGVVYSDDLMDNLFSRFCVGK